VTPSQPCGGTLQSLPIKMLHDYCLNDSVLSVIRERLLIINK